MSTFEIPDAPTIVELERTASGPASGAIIFNVTNKSEESCTGRLSIAVAGDAKRDWFSVEGERERIFAADETQTATVRINVPDEVPAGTYPFRLRVVHVNDPDNDYAEGPTTAAKMPAAVVEPVEPAPPPEKPPPPAPSPGRPRPMTIIGWLLVAGGAVSLLMLVTLLGTQRIWVYGFMGVVIILSGYGVLKGHNWSRFLLAGSGLLATGVFLGSNWGDLVGLLLLVGLGVIGFFLFRPGASAWFNRSEEAQGRPPL